jgi:hypothetical protein
MKLSNPKTKNGFLFVLLLSITLVTASSATAKTRCGGALGNQCISEVDFTQFAQTAFQQQRHSEWCWAAAISMLFSYYQHPVSQERIVTSLYGRLVNLPSGPSLNIAARLNSPWIDDHQQSFKPTVSGAYDFDAGVLTITNAWLVNELDQDRPFIIGTNGHAVVVTAIRFIPTQPQPTIVGMGVFDPWPGRGARGLLPKEMIPMHVNTPQGRGQLRFIATVNVSD